jgi:hypothetical protein
MNHVTEIWRKKTRASTRVRLLWLVAQMLVTGPKTVVVSLLVQTKDFI